jgi:hypothetical protein
MWPLTLVTFAELVAGALVEEAELVVREVVLVAVEVEDEESVAAVVL